MSNPDPQNKTGVTPLCLAVAALILILLSTVALPRLKAVSEDRARPEPPRILSAYDRPLPSAVESGGTGGGVVSAVSSVP
jgi:hypothetical protein